MSRKSVLVGWLVLALVCCCLLVTQICLVDFLKPFFFFFFFFFNVPDPYVGLDPAFTGFICLDLDLTFTSSLWCGGQLTDRGTKRASKTQTTSRQECDQASKTQTTYRQECDQASKTQTTYRQECDQASNTDN